MRTRAYEPARRRPLVNCIGVIDRDHQDSHGTVTQAWPWHPFSGLWRKFDAIAQVKYVDGNSTCKPIFVMGRGSCRVSVFHIKQVNYMADRRSVMVMLSMCILALVTGCDSSPNADESSSAESDTPAEKKNADGLFQSDFATVKELAKNGPVSKQALDRLARHIVASSNCENPEGRVADVGKAIVDSGNLSWLLHFSSLYVGSAPGEAQCEVVWQFVGRHTTKFFESKDVLKADFKNYVYDPEIGIESLALARRYLRKIELFIASAKRDDVKRVASVWKGSLESLLEEFPD